jgi:hypothetical protein
LGRDARSIEPQSCVTDAYQVVVNSLTLSALTATAYTCELAARWCRAGFSRIVNCRNLGSVVLRHSTPFTATPATCF